MIIDALQCGHFDRDILSMLKQGKYTCVTPTLGIWEGTMLSMEAIGKWRDLERENSDLMRIIRRADDIRQCEKDGKVGILMGYQNSNLFEGHIRFVELFADMGVRVVQLTYNNQNELAGSCYEENDSGLARFGKEVITEMARAGIVVDCSHVGDRSTLDAIEHSPKPIAITHANPASVFPHKRNRSDDVLRALAQTGGVIGCATYRPITPLDAADTVEGFCTLIARTVEIAGVDHVGLGTDFSHNTTQVDLNWFRKGYWTRGVDYGAGSAQNPGKSPKPDWLLTADRLGVLEQGLRDIGFSAEEATKIMGGNWLRLYETVFG